MSQAKSKAKERQRLLTSKLLQIRVKNRTKKLYVQIQAYKDMGVFVRYKTRNAWWEMKNVKAFVTQHIANEQDKERFIKTLREAQDKYAMHYGIQPIIYPLPFKTYQVLEGNNELQEVKLRLYAPSEVNRPIIVEYYDPSIQKWEKLYGDLRERFPDRFQGSGKREWEYIQQWMTLVAHRRANAMKRSHANFQFFQLDGIYYAVYGTFGKGRCTLARLALPTGEFREIKDVNAYLEETDLPVEHVDKIQKKYMTACIQDYGHKEKQIANLTEEKLLEKGTMRGFDVKRTVHEAKQHPYICPPKNNPKACLFDEKKKICVEPKPGIKCRHLRNQLRNRTKNLYLLFHHFGLDVKKVVDDAFPFYNHKFTNICEMFYSAAMAGGHSTNLRGLFKKAKQLYAKRKGLPLSTDNPPVESTADLRILYEVIDVVYFDHSLIPFSVEVPPPMKPLKMLLIKMKNRKQELAFFEHTRVEIVLYLATIKRQWADTVEQIRQEGHPSRTAIETDGVPVRNEFELILSTLNHELAHYLNYRFGCIEDFQGGHTPSWTALYKYFFGGGHQDISNANYTIEID